MPSSRCTGSARPSPRSPDRPNCLAIRIGNQMSGTGKMAPYRVDSDASSGRLGRTDKTSWTSQMGLRSRWRRFESCRGRFFCRGIFIRSLAVTTRNSSRRPQALPSGSLHNERSRITAREWGVPVVIPGQANLCSPGSKRRLRSGTYTALSGQ